ncbi:MAG: hypothetical protein HDR17_02315 [Lachnospiraceae bacterium]|nr:hypothetical protein [Lachnospiraceae bacterium]
MQQTEYDELQRKLTRLHDDILAGEQSIRKCIATLMTYEGGFYVQAISEKVIELLNEMETSAVSSMYNFYNADVAVSDLIALTIETDVMDE